MVDSSEASEQEVCVCIVGDDENMRNSLGRLVRSQGWDAEVFSCGEDFMHQPPKRPVDCVIVDVRMTSLTGPAPHDWVRAKDMDVGVIFVSAYNDVATSVKAMKQGAADFLLKPVDDVVMIQAIRDALRSNTARKAIADEKHEILTTYAGLTPREQEVMQHVVRGRLNKQIASDLGISVKTVKVHRGRVLEKMGVRSVAHLVHLCLKGELESA